MLTNRFGGSNQHGSLLVFTLRPASKAVRPNRSLNRTLCGGPGLGFKSLAQMPAHRNGPVSSNVRPHIFNAVLRQRPRIQRRGNTSLLQDCEMSERNRVPKLFQAARNKLIRQEATRGIRNRETMCLTANDKQTITRSAYVAAPRKSFKFVGGASRRRAAPRSQSSGAAQVGQCHFIG